MAKADDTFIKLQARQILLGPRQQDFVRALLYSAALDLQQVVRNTQYSLERTASLHY
jgi:hypothetical protein